MEKEMIDMSIELSRLYRAAFTSLKRGDIVSRKSDPVHVGQIIGILVRNGKRFASVRWLPSMMLEDEAIDCDDLQVTEEWK
jgi:hypothetical protein